MQLFNGDCLEVMKSIQDKSVDCIVTDPPYKVTARGNSGTMGGYWKTDIAKKGNIFKFNDISCKDYLPEFYRVLKDKSLCFVMCNNINLQEIINTGINAGFNFVKCLIWEKGNKICGRYFMNCFEYIVLFRKDGDRPINHCGTPDILKVPVKKLKDKYGHNLHDTEKPVELMEILVENGSNEGDTVLDPFLGIGSTGVAAVKNHRDFIGIELDKKYFEIAKKRIEQSEKEKEYSLFF